MQINPGQHLSFCLNVFALDNLDKIFSVLTNECLKVKNIVSQNQEMGLGLWLSAEVVEELQDSGKLDVLKASLKNHNLYVFTLNIFPYGNFHQSPVKEKVYYPDWGDKRRLDYTCKAARVLTSLCPDKYGSMSTVPVTYGKELPEQSVEFIRQCSQYLMSLKEETGIKIELAFEPEPDCYLETCDETVDFFNLLKDKCTKEEMTYLGVCLDTCHSALQFESPIENIQKYIDCGIQLSKIQISAAPILYYSDEEDKNQLVPFSEPVYLHQTRVLNESGIIESYADLPEALSNASKGEWRCHFHIPLHFKGDGALQSTNKDLNKDFFDLAKKHCQHFETETYTYFVLPNATESITESIRNELMWVKAKL
ncbi:metabolite traffic protein EboE [Lentisphaera marina]|uniref:metabolite traffic protein EboE n=1 Tax=Lentisphaera marina TaxID=1111041 RepID=UPI002366F6BC|nr:metabolite traffic protein EboE [Lentisphaera marina]MDD7986285.1 metabolite traffic protein EboE [Lentisphaera marina]